MNNKLYIVIDEEDGIPIMQDPKDPDIKVVRFSALKLGEEQNDEE